MMRRHKPRVESRYGHSDCGVTVTSPSSYPGSRSADYARKRCLAIREGLATEILAVEPQQIKGDITRIPCASHQIAIIAANPLRVRQKPFGDPDWLFELKYDGYRGLLHGPLLQAQQPC